jgi:DNA-binding XRE family transcriptional regulator
MRLREMINDAVKRIIKERRTMTPGQLVDAILSGRLRAEVGLDKNAFAELIGITRKTLREIEGWEKTPKMSMVFNAATAFGIKLNMMKASDENH